MPHNATHVVTLLCAVITISWKEYSEDSGSSCNSPAGADSDLDDLSLNVANLESSPNSGVDTELLGGQRNMEAIAALPTQQVDTADAQASN